MSNPDALKLFVAISYHRMCGHYLPKLLQAVQSLSKDQLWVHERPRLNSIGGIVLHLCEHVHRSMVRHSIAGVSFPKGIEDHFPDENMSAEELTLIIQDRFAEWSKVMSSYAGNDTGTDKVSAGGAGSIEVDMHHLYHLIEHTGYHLGQIIDRAKRLSGVSFQFCQNGINEKALKSLIESGKPDF